MNISQQEAAAMKLKNAYLRYLFPFTALALLAKLVIVLAQFHFRVTDNDQALFWLGCHDFSEGHFYTPFIYGCNYGNMLECLLAVPFYKAGIPIYYALPLSSALWLFGLLVLAARQINQRFPQHQSGSFLLFCMCFLSTDFYALSLAPKGHMSGIFVVLLAMNLVLAKQSTLTMLLAGLLMGLGMQFNPNALFLLIASFLFIKNPRQLISIAGGAVISLAYKLLTSHYALITDTGHLHGQWGIEFTWKDLASHIKDVDTYLNMLTPFLSKMGFLSFAIPLIFMTLCLLKRQWFLSLVSAGYIAALLFSFGINKISDGADDVFFSYSRFFLSVAYGNAIFMSLLYSRVGPGKTNRAFLSLIPVFMLLNLPYTNISAREAASNCGRNTMSVKKSSIEDIKSEASAMLNMLDSCGVARPRILVSDYQYYSSLLYFATTEPANTICHFHCSNMFYWKQGEIDPSTKYDIVMVLGFDKLLEARKASHGYAFHPARPLPFFIFRAQGNAGKLIDELLK